jgi:membrane protease subunit HflC
MKNLLPFAVLLALIALLACVYTVREDQTALMLRLGQVVKSDIQPGLHFKLPFVNTVVKFDRRVLTLVSQPARFLTSEKKEVVVDASVKWRIKDVTAFYQATRGDEIVANQRLGQFLQDRLRDEFNKRTLQDVVANERGNLMQDVTQSTGKLAAPLGVEVLDVRIKAIELPDAVISTVFERMRSERTRVANDLRSRGNESGEQIRAEADRQIQVLLAEAEREGQKMRGEGDARAAQIYAQAYGRDAEFYAFLRSLQAYRESFNRQGDVLVLDPNSEFFRFFGEQPTRPR